MTWCRPVPGGMPGPCRPRRRVLWLLSSCAGRRPTQAGLPRSAPHRPRRGAGRMGGRSVRHAGQRARGDPGSHRGVDLVESDHAARLRRLDAAPMSWPCTATTPSPHAGSVHPSRPSLPPTGSTRSSTSWPRPRAAELPGEWAGCFPCARATSARYGWSPWVVTGSTWCRARTSRRGRTAGGQRHDLGPELTLPSDPEPGGRARRLHPAGGVAPTVHVLTDRLTFPIGTASPDGAVAPGSA